MLLSSILRILSQHQAQPKVVNKTPVEKFEIKPALTAEEPSRPQKTEIEITPVGGLQNPPLSPQPTGALSTGQNLGELIRAVTKFEKSEESRVVDVFE